MPDGAKSGMVITVIRGPSKVTYERQVKALRMLTTHGFRNKHMQEALLSVRQPDRRDLDDTFNKGTRRIWDEAQAMELDGTIQHAVMNHPKTATAAMLRHNKRSEEANVIEKEIQNLAVRAGAEAGKGGTYELLSMEVINRAAVVCATCMTAGSDLLNTSTFTHVLLDEATQSTEA
eukprot:gene16823-19987_t